MRLFHRHKWTLVDYKTYVWKDSPSVISNVDVYARCTCGKLKAQTLSRHKFFTEYRIVLDGELDSQSPTS